MRKRAVIYVRISRDRRRGSLNEGIGVREQESECRVKLADGREYDVVAVFIDNDISAYSGKPRPEYLKMLEFLRAGKADVVLCWHTDRLHRDNTELEDYIKVVEPRDIQTESVKAGLIDLNTATGRMVARNLCTIARYESEHRAERVALARARQARQGQYGGGPRRPYGFQSDGITVNENEAEVIRSMARAVLSGVSLRSIARDLRTLGLLTSSDTLWTSDGVRSVLLRPRSAGFMVYRETKKGTKKSRYYTDDDIVGTLPGDPILIEDEWRAVVAKLTDPKRRTNTATGPAPKYLGTGIYRCTCGAVMRVNKSKQKKNRPIYRCTQTSAGHVTIGVEDTDELVVGIVIEELSQPDAAELIVPREPDIDLPGLRAELATHRQRLNEVTEDYNADRITRAQMLMMTASRRAKIADIERQLTDATDVSPLLPLIGAEDIRAEWDKLTLGEKRAVLQAVVTVTILPAGRGNRAKVEHRIAFGPGQPRKRPV